METVTLKVPENCEKEGCFLVSFSNGQLNSSSTNQPKFSLYNKVGGTATKKRKIMVAETDQMTYIGTNYEESSHTSAANLCKYYIGSLDKQKGTMTIQRTELIHLRPYIPGKTDLDLSEESPVKLERSQVQDEMVALFGSERQKRAFAAYKRNKVDTEALETALASAVTHAGTSQETANDGSVRVQGSGLAPPYNPQAETPQDVYDITDILSLDDLRAVKVVGKVLTEATRNDIAQWRENASYPAYVLDHVSSLPLSEPERSLKAALLLYSSWLIQMYTHKPKEFEKKEQVNGNDASIWLQGKASEYIPEQMSDDIENIHIRATSTQCHSNISGEPPPPDVEEHFLEKFSEKSPDARRKDGKPVSRRLSYKMKDKVLLHLLVLTLILDDFNVNCSTLQQDLKVTTRKLMDNYKSLGCHVSKLGVKRKSGVDGDSVDTTSCSAMLQIPLEFPKIKKGRRSR